MLKRDPTGNCFDNLGTDVVYRIYHSSFYYSSSCKIIDAVRLSPAQIKEVLDLRPFDQATEDQFRVIDGRGASDQDMFDRPEVVRPKRPTPEELQEMQRQIDEKDRLGVNKDSHAVCGLRRSNYNLDPK